MILKSGALILGLTLFTPLFAEEGPAGANDEGAAFDFAAMDANGDGQISKEELSAFHATRRAKADLDKDGFLSAAEMKAQMRERLEARIDRMVARRIKHRDKNGDGKLGPDEDGGQDRQHRLFSRADGNGDGMLSQAEMKAARAHLQ
ncbi:MAG: hypothetical protein ORN49_02725, partial [Rhodobacteraceae bacterium]|nr:hypothetical protein [Paracoccaceae bacterium]